MDYWGNRFEFVVSNLPVGVGITTDGKRHFYSGISGIMRTDSSRELETKLTEHMVKVTYRMYRSVNHDNRHLLSCFHYDHEAMALEPKFKNCFCISKQNSTFIGQKYSQHWYSIYTYIHKQTQIHTQICMYIHTCQHIWSISFRFQISIFVFPYFDKLQTLCENAWFCLYFSHVFFFLGSLDQKPLLLTWINLNPNVHN